MQPGAGSFAFYPFAFSPIAFSPFAFPPLAKPSIKVDKPGKGSWCRSCVPGLYSDRDMALGVKMSFLGALGWSC